MTFQEVILTLQRFWADRGCIIAQPYDIEVGAGTMNPHTFLRCLGPEPWNVAYVEPSRRPTDGRYGENPNRLQHYYQYPGHPEALAARHPGPLHRKPQGPGHRPPGPRHPVRRGRLGKPHAGRLGAGLGGVAGRHGDHPVHLFPAGGRASTAGRCAGRSPTASSASPCTCRASTTSTTSSGRRGISYGDVHHRGEVEGSHLQLRTVRRQDALRR